MFSGVKVYGHHVVVEYGESQQIISGNALNIPENFSVTPAISPGQAMVYLSGFYKGIPAGHKDIELVIAESGGNPVLAYRVSYLSSNRGVLSRPAGLINASNGDVIRHWDELMTAKPDGKGKPGGGETAVVAAHLPLTLLPAPGQ